MPKKQTLKAKFKRAVANNCSGECENPHCDAEMNSAHHFFKVSKYPEFQHDPDNGCGLCGLCHAEVERRERMGISTADLMPMDRYGKMEAKICQTRK